MAKNAITDYSTTAASNTDVGGVGIQGTNAISNADDAFREIMSHLAETNAGTSPWADTMTIGDAADLTKEFRFEASAITAGQTRVITLPDANVTIPSGTLVTEAGSQVLTNKTLTSPVLTTPQINDTSADHQYVVAVSELAADRTVTLPLLATDDEFVFKAHHVQAQATWEAGVGTTESLVTPAKIAAAIAALVGAGTAALSYGGVGTYVFGYYRNTNGLAANETIAGSDIEPAGLTNSGAAPADDAATGISFTKGGSALSGTWRVMGQSNEADASDRSRITLFLRTV